MVVGVTVDQLRRARYRWAVAGGADKYAVLRAALVGRWINRLVTDTVTAIPSAVGRTFVSTPCLDASASTCGYCMEICMPLKYSSRRTA